MTLHRSLCQSDLDAARELLSLKDQFAQVRNNNDQQFREEDGKIDKSFVALEAKCKRMASRLSLRQAIDPINLVSIQQLLDELAEMPQNERFQDDEVEQAQKAYELHGKKLQEALSALDTALVKKQSKLLLQVSA